MKNSDKKTEINDCWNTIGVWSNVADRCGILRQVIHCQNCSVYAKSGRLLLDRELPSNYSESWENSYQRSKFEADKGDQIAIVFRVGNEWLALPLGFMDEITNIRQVHSIPHKKNQALQGLVNINGVLLVCICLQQMLKIEDRPGERLAASVPHARMIVISKGNNKYVVPVNETKNTIRYNLEDLTEPPTTLSKTARIFIHGVLLQEDQHIGVIGSDVLFGELERSLL